MFKTTWSHPQCSAVLDDSLHAYGSQINTCTLFPSWVLDQCIISYCLFNAYALMFLSALQGDVWFHHSLHYFFYISMVNDNHLEVENNSHISHWFPSVDIILRLMYPLLTTVDVVSSLNLDNLGCRCLPRIYLAHNWQKNFSKVFYKIFPLWGWVLSRIPSCFSNVSLC